MVTFTKFGSCVTSDVFNFMNISNYYPKHIYTGINIATAVHKADIPILEEDLVEKCKSIVFHMRHLMIV